MSYRRPHMSMEFIDASTPRVNFPVLLPEHLIGHLAQVETGVFVGEYDNEADLEFVIPDIMDGAKLIPGKVGVKIVLNATGDEIDVPEEDGDNWEIDFDENTGTIKSGIVDVTSDQTVVAVDEEVECSNGGGPPTTYTWRTGANEFTFVGTTNAKPGHYLQIRQVAAAAPTGDMSLNRILSVGVSSFIVEGTLPVIGDRVAGDRDNYKVVYQAANGVLNTTTHVLSDDTIDFGKIGLITGQSQAVLVRPDGTQSDPIFVSLQDDGTLLLLGVPVYPAGMNEEYVEYKIVIPASGKVFVPYYALRSDLNETRIRVTRSTLLNVMGGNQAIIPDNPIAFAAWLALQVSNEVYISCPDESDASAFVDNSECDEVEWGKTLTYLRTLNRYESAYSFVCLVQNTQIISLLELFIDWMRDPDVARFCCGYGSFPRTFEDVAVDTEDVPAVMGDTLTFVDATQDYLAAGVNVGSWLELKDTEGTIYKRQVAAVAPGAVVTTLTLYTKTPNDAMTDWTYRVVNAYYSAYDEAGIYKNYAQAYGNRAFRLVWPHELTGKFRGTTYRVPSYYWQAYWAARLAASEDVGMPHTNVAVTLFFTGIVLPSIEFKDDSIVDQILSGGIECVWQNTSSSPIFSIHQHTTDMSTVNTMEQSIVHQFDYAGMVLLTNFEKFVGVIKLDNKGKALLSTIYTASRKHIVDDKKALQTLTLIRLVTDPVDKTLILLEVEGEASPPFNGGHIKMYMV